MSYIQDFAQCIWFAILQLKENEVKDIICEGIPEEYHSVVIKVVREVLREIERGEQ